MRNKCPQVLFDHNGNRWEFIQKHLSFTGEKLFQYRNESVSRLLRIKDIEKNFTKEGRSPSKDPIQQEYYECALASLSMLTKISVDNIRKHLLTLGWHKSQGVNLALQKKLLRKLGFSSMIHDNLPNQECVVAVPSLNTNNKSHQIYWDGKEILDPQLGTKYLSYGANWDLATIGAFAYITVEKLKEIDGNI